MGRPSKTAQLKAFGFAQGYVTAQDRMVQLEFFRRAGKGRLSEIGFLGPSFLPGDIVARRDGFTEAEFQQQFKKLPAKGRIALQSFADGVNRFLDEVAADPSLAPAEFGLLGLRRRIAGVSQQIWPRRRGRRGRLQADRRFRQGGAKIGDGQFCRDREIAEAGVDGRGHSTVRVQAAFVLGLTSSV